MPKLVIEVNIDDEVFDNDTSADVATVVRNAADAIEEIGVGAMDLERRQARLTFAGRCVGQAWVSHHTLILD